MKKNMFVILTILIVFISYSCVFAVDINPGIGSSNSGTMGGDCKTACWNSVGVRLGIYKLSKSGGKVSAIRVGNSHDFWRVLSGVPDETSTKFSEKNPSNIGSPLFLPRSFDDVTSKKSSYSVKKSDFTISRSGYSNYTLIKASYSQCGSSTGTVESDLNHWCPSPYSDYDKFRNSYAKWINNPKNIIFQQVDNFIKMKNKFNITDTNVSDINENIDDYYIVLEPMSSLWLDNKNNYVGTAYQLAWTSSKHALALNLARTIYVTSQYGNNPYFVGNSNAYLLSASGDEITNVKKNYAYGLNVYKLSDIITEKTCKSVCGSSPTLKCAENYCESISKNSTSKKTCMKTKCDISWPTYTTTSSTCSPNGTGICTSDTKIYKKTTGNTINSTGYYKYNCTETSNLNYSNDLPVNFENGIGGFNSSLYVKGTKTCTLTFLKDLFEKDYAAFKRSDTNRTSMLAKLKDYKELNTPNTNFSYDVSKLNATLTVSGKSPINYQIIKDDSSQSINKSDDKTIYLYGASLKTESLKSTVNYTNNFSQRLQLPYMCYSRLNGSTYYPSIGNRCASGDIYSYAVFSELTTDSSKVPVTIKVKDDNSCMDDTNTCFYTNKSGNATCQVNYEKVSGSTNKYNVYYTLINRDGLSVKAYPGDGNFYTKKTGWTYNYSVTVEPGLSKKINSYVIYKIGSDEIRAYCSQTIKNTPSLNSCRDTCKNSKGYECAQNWCTDNLNDYCGDNPTCGHKTCVDYCYRDTCKVLDSNDYNVIKAWCSSDQAKTYPSYKSESACINDCYSPGTPSDNTAEYIYRPVELGGSIDSNPGSTSFSAFPNRKAGSNWIGYESKYTSNKNVTSGSPIYSIYLDAEKIKLISSELNKSEYKNFNDVKKEGSNVYYKSSFIDIHSEIFTNTSGRSGY